MKRWIVFDRSTAEAADTPDREVELHDIPVAEALSESVQTGKPVVVVVPAGADQVTVARITPPGSQSR